MEIRCALRAIDSELLRWAKAEELWDALKLGNFATVSENILPRTRYIEVEFDRPDLKGPNSQEAVISTSDEAMARKSFVRAIINFAFENREQVLAALISEAESAVHGKADIAAGEMAIPKHPHQH